MKAIVKQLEEMKIGRYQYAGQIHKIKDIAIDEEKQKFEITTDLNVFTRKFESGSEFLKKWTHVTDSLPASVNPAQQIVAYNGSETALADEMINVLKDNIK